MAANLPESGPIVMRENLASMLLERETLVVKVGAWAKGFGNCRNIPLAVMTVTGRG